MRENRWFVLAILFIARFVLGYQFQSAGSVAPFLIRDFDISYAQVGILVGLFMLPGLVVSIPSGILGRRFGDKNVVLSGLALMAIGGGMSGIAETFWMILTGRVLSGIGGVFLFVLMTKMLTDWFADKELYLGMAIFIIGWPIGIAAAQATQGHLAELQSWNVVFISSAVLVLIAFSLMALFYLPPSEQSQSVSSPRGRLSHPEIGLVCIAGLIWMFLNGAYLVMLSFGPAQLIERGISIVGAGFVVSVMSWVFMFALPAGGYVATRYQVPNLMMVGGLAVSAVVGALIPFMPSPLLTFALFGIAFAAATPIIASLPAEVLEPRNRGPGFGVYWLWYFGGLPVLTALGGVLKDLTGTAAASVIFAAAMMLMCLLLLGVFRFLQSRWVLWPQGMAPRNR
jgi:MFS family permease